MGVAPLRGRPHSPAMPHTSPAAARHPHTGQHVPPSPTTQAQRWGVRAALIPTQSLPGDARLFLESCAPSPGETSPRILGQWAPPSSGPRLCVLQLCTKSGRGWVGSCLPGLAARMCECLGASKPALRSAGTEGGGDARAGGLAGELPAHSTHMFYKDIGGGFCSLLHCILFKR